MRLIVLTLLALLAFAGNSILNRWALLDNSTGPITFSFVRVVSGATFFMDYSCCFKLQMATKNSNFSSCLSCGIHTLFFHRIFKLRYRNWGNSSIWWCAIYNVWPCLINFRKNYCMENNWRSNIISWPLCFISAE